MPELPEVETVRQGLERLIGKKVGEIFRSEKKLRSASTLDLHLLKHGLVIKIKRRARYLIINFVGAAHGAVGNSKNIAKNKLGNVEEKYSLILHLGMSGSIVVDACHSRKSGNLSSKNLTNYTYSTAKYPQHDHFICSFEDGSRFVFNDPRRFGFVDLIYSKDLPRHKMLAKLGCEPLSDEFNAEYLSEKLRNKKMNIKTVMMDNEIVVGVGNIYINESLFAVRISPLRAANSLKKTEITKLVHAIKTILQKAIELGGSSISDYVDSAGNRGNFQDNFKVYGKAGKKCLHCSGVIAKIVQNGRSSFYCPTCQK